MRQQHAINADEPSKGLTTAMMDGIPAEEYLDTPDGYS